MSTLSLQGKTVLVTRSSRGRGLAVGLALRQAGAEVAFHGEGCRPAEIPAGAAYCSTDLAHPEGHRELLWRATNARPQLNVLVCHVRSPFPVPLIELAHDSWNAAVQLNITATCFLVQEFARHLAAQKVTGSVVLVELPGPDHVDRSHGRMLGGFIPFLTGSLAASFQGLGIRVNGVSYGATTSDCVEAGKVSAAQEAGLRVPGDDIGAVTFLCSSAAGDLTGRVAVVGPR